VFILLFREFEELGPPELVRRDMGTGEAKRGHAISIIGPRRAGKTFCMFQLIQELEARRPGERALYLNLEDDRLLNISLEDMDLVLPAFRELHPEAAEGRIHLFFDEVQAVEGWERYVRRLLDTEDAAIYLSGSSSRLLSKEVHTSMRGRSLPYVVMPLSFREYLMFREVDIAGVPTSREMSVMLAHLREFMTHGGFPNVVLEPDAILKRRMLREYVDVMLMRDVVERYDLRNVAVLRGLLVKVVASVSSEFSINRYHGQLKGQGIKVSKDTLYEYLDHLEEAFAVIIVRRHSPKLVQPRQSLPKVYPVDTGMITQTEGRSSEDLGTYMEAIVAIELARRRNEDPSLEVFYWRDPNGKEVDFVLKHGLQVTRLVQVCYDASSPDTLGREVKALMKAGSELGCDDLLVLTWDVDRVEESDDTSLRFLPLWRWLLEPDL
jgi:predicted AAA+ superfamily ATPase